MSPTPPKRSTPRLVLRLLRVPLALLVLLVLVGGGTYLLAPGALLRADAWRQALAAHLATRTVQIGDTRWSYYEGGDGATLVLLHGFDMDKTAWLPVAARLQPHFHLVIPDLPGWGHSSRHAGDDYGIPAQARRLQAFVQTLGLGHVVLVGHSMGGAIAGVYAAEHPEHVAGLVLVDSFGLKSSPTDFERAVLAGSNPYVLADRAEFRQLLQAAFDQPPAVPGRIADVFVDRSQDSRDFLDRTLDALRSPDERTILQQHLGELRMPVLGLWCRDDKIIDLSALEALRQGLTHASSIDTSVINGCGHVPQMEKPRAVAQIISGFVIAN
ncbi:MAG TPA: alpha/beta fold hydrolase [Rhodanobacteraceae bacterium]|nr:alpha/beta fold hydrolase [Rhodanobacteraceae bacterium]